jgi:hypothetical protein
MSQKTGHRQATRLSGVCCSRSPARRAARCWENPTGHLDVTLTDPDGNTITPDALLEADTHRQLRVRNPVPGTWTVDINLLKPTNEIHFVLSGKSTTTLLAAGGAIRMLTPSASRSPSAAS